MLEDPQQEHNWSDDRILELIHEIEKLRCLWDPKDKTKKNRDKKKEAFRLLAEKFEVPPEEIKKKFNVLLQSYRNCRRKIANKSDTGTCNVYKPVWFAYEALNKFMAGVYTPRGPIETMAPGEESDGSEGIDDIANTSSVIIVKESSNVETSLVKEEIDIVTNDLQENLRTNEYHVPSKFRKIRKRQSSTDDEFFLKDIDEENKVRNEKDECAIFGELVAAKLRKLDEISRQCLMNDMHNLMFQARISTHYKSSASREVSVSSPPYSYLSASSPRSN